MGRGASLRWAAAASVAAHAALLFGSAAPVLISAGANRPAVAESAPLVSRLIGREPRSPEAANLEQTSTGITALTQPTASTAPVALAAETRQNTAGPVGNTASAVDQQAGSTPPPVQPIAAALPPAQAEQKSPAPSQPTIAGYRDAQLDPPPRPIEVPEPIYPEEAGERDGVVVVRLYVGADGRVDQAVVVRANPPGWFEKSALAAFSQARFSPGYYLGVPVKSQITIELNYSPTNRGGAVSGQGAVR